MIPAIGASREQGWRRTARRTAEWISALSLATLFGSFMIGVVARYVFNHPVSWTLEICSIAYVWVVFWTSNLLLDERQHIVFDVLFGALPEHPRRWVAIANTMALGALFLAALPVVAEYLFGLRRTSLILHVPFTLIYSCFVLFMVAVIVGAGLRLRHLLFDADWRRHL